MLNHFPELLTSESNASKMDLKELLTLLLNTKLLSIHEEADDKIFLKFHTKKVHSLIYNFITRDLKTEYHICIASMLLQRSNNNTQPSSIFEIGIQFYRGNYFQKALLCFYVYGEYLYSLGAQTDALKIFEKAYEVCNILFQENLNVELNDIQSETFHDKFSIKFSLQEMFDLVEGSNLILRTIISTLIRLGHCLVTYDRKKVSTVIYPQAIQIFMSSRINNSFKKLDEAQPNLIEAIFGSDLKFLEKTSFLISEAKSNIGLIIFYHYYNHYYNSDIKRKLAIISLLYLVYFLINWMLCFPSFQEI